MKVKITGIHEEDGFSDGVQLKNGESVSVVGMTGTLELLPNVVVPDYHACTFTPDEVLFEGLPEVLFIAVQYEELPNDT